MVAQYLDLTAQAQDEGFVQFEASNYDYAVVQIMIGSGDPVNFYGTLNSGAVQGVTDGNIFTSDDYVSITAVNLATGAYTSFCDGTDGIFKFDVVSRYIIISPCSDATKVLVMLTKIS